MADSSQLDFETSPVFNLTVTVTDAGGLTDTAAITINVTDVNEAPTVSLQNTITLLSENIDTTARIKVADIVVADDALGTNVLSLTGADAGLFEVDGAELYLKAGVSLDFETNPVLDVTVEVDDASLPATPEDSTALAITVANVSEAPSASDAILAWLRTVPTAPWWAASRPATRMPGTRSATRSRAVIRPAPSPSTRRRARSRWPTRASWTSRPALSST